MPKKFEAENIENLPEIEKYFAVKAVEQAQTYWNLIESIPPTSLKLTRIDDEIYEHFRTEFPELVANAEKIQRLDEEWLKNSEGKERWKRFIASYEKKVKNYDSGSLIRTDSTDDYSQTNPIFVTNMQFYAIEIARNRLGLNDIVYQRAQDEKAELKALADKKEKTFSADGNRKTHEKVHAPPGQYFKCNICTTPFSRDKGRTAHEKCYHTVR